MLAGAIAIAGLPPFNGFVSEWLTFQAIVSSPRLPQPLLRLGVPLFGALLALAAALAAVCFVRLFGIVFLGRPRSPAAAAAAPPPRLLTAPLLGLGALCLALGGMPVIGFALIDPVVGTLGLPAFLPAGADWLAVGLGDAAAGGRATAYSGLALGLTALALGVIVALVLARTSPAAGRRGAPWDCGFPEPSPATQYTASSFSQPLRRIFGPVFQERERVDMPAPLDTRAASFAVSLRDLMWTTLYEPPARLIDALATRLNVVQFLTIRRYLSLTFAALVILMLVVVLGP
jgi:NADH:ubiquinone oxidoreductase subunit 5 (subunit L)/multisubunit Na+/H+ antiporter MnhA subunit